MTFVAIAAVALCMTAVPPVASAKSTKSESRESQAEAILASEYWSKTMPATEAQKANRKALPVDVKEALATVALDEVLSEERTESKPMTLVEGRCALIRHLWSSSERN
jgi:hypothetical protein